MELKRLHRKEYLILIMRRLVIRLLILLLFFGSRYSQNLVFSSFIVRKYVTCLPVLVFCESSVKFHIVRKGPNKSLTIQFLQKLTSTMQLSLRKRIWRVTQFLISIPDFGKQNVRYFRSTQAFKLGNHSYYLLDSVHHNHEDPVMLFGILVNRKSESKSRKSINILSIHNDVSPRFGNASDSSAICGTIDHFFPLIIDSVMKSGSDEC